jgi:hypothetical protein
MRGRDMNENKKIEEIEKLKSAEIVEMINKLKISRGLNKERFSKLKSMFDMLKYLLGKVEKIEPQVEIELTGAIVSEIGILNEKMLDLLEIMIHLFALVDAPNLEHVETPKLEQVDTQNLEPSHYKQFIQKTNEIFENKCPEGYN